MTSAQRTDEACSRAAGENTRATIVFDFDGTLVSRDSFFDFSLRFCLRRPARILFVALSAPWALLATLRSVDAALSVFLWAMTFGVSTRQFVELLRSYAREVLPGAVNEAIWEELRAHHGAGNRVAIATGSLPLLVRELSTARGLPGLAIVGSRLRRKWGGLVAETHCTGPTKVHELERRFGITRWSAVYTNSFADRALMLGTPDITLVGPSRSTLLRTRRLIGPGTTLRVLPAR